MEGRRAAPTHVHVDFTSARGPGPTGRSTTPASVWPASPGSAIAVGKFVSGRHSPQPSLPVGPRDILLPETPAGAEPQRALVPGLHDRGRSSAGSWVVSAQLGRAHDREPFALADYRRVEAHAHVQNVRLFPRVPAPAHSPGAHEPKELVSRSLGDRVIAAAAVMTSETMPLNMDGLLACRLPTPRLPLAGHGRALLVWKGSELVFCWWRGHCRHSEPPGPPEPQRRW